MKEDISEIKQELKEANRRADEEAAGRKRLFDKLEKFMDDQKSNSAKYSGQKNEEINDGRDLKD